MIGSVSYGVPKKTAVAYTDSSFQAGTAVFAGISFAGDGTAELSFYSAEKQGAVQVTPKAKAKKKGKSAGSAAQQASTSSSSSSGGDVVEGVLKGFTWRRGDRLVLHSQPPAPIGDPRDGDLAYSKTRFVGGQVQPPVQCEFFPLKPYRGRNISQKEKVRVALEVLIQEIKRVQ